MHCFVRAMLCVRVMFCVEDHSKRVGVESLVLGTCGLFHQIHEDILVRLSLLVVLLARCCFLTGMAV